MRSCTSSRSWMPSTSSETPGHITSIGDGDGELGEGVGLGGGELGRALGL